MRALSNEVCKNIALAGIGSITLLDDGIVEEQDLGAQFFLNENHIGKNVCIYMYVLYMKNIKRYILIMRN